MTLIRERHKACDGNGSTMRDMNKGSNKRATFLDR